MNYIEAVTLAKQGKEEGFNYLYQETYQKSYYVALKYMKQDDAAMDVLQDAYIKAFANLDQLEDADKFPGWFSRVVATKALDALKKKKTVLFSEMEDEDGIGAEEMFAEDRIENLPEAAMDQAETARLVREMIDTLTDEQRMCVLMFYMEQMSVKEIAETLGVSENTIKSRLNYGRKNIKEKVLELEKQGTKLYGMAPVAFFAYLLLSESRSATVAYAATAATASVVSTAVAETAATAVEAGASVAATAAGGGTAASVTGTASTVAGGKAATGLAAFAGTAIGGIIIKGLALVGCVVALVGGVMFVIDHAEFPGKEIEQGTENEQGTNQPEENPNAGQSNPVIYKNDTILVELVGTTIYIRGTGTVPVLADWIEPWAEQADAIVVDEGIEVIGNCALGSMEGIERVTVADSVTRVEPGAFMYSDFTEINLPDTITYIGVQAFTDCEKLVAMKLPDSLQELGNHAFYGCESLTTITVPAGVVLKNTQELFYGAKQLSAVIYKEGTTAVEFSSEHGGVMVQIPSSVTEIRLTGVGRIYGELDSYAHQYATEYGIEFWVGEIGSDSAYKADEYEVVIARPECPEFERLEGILGTACEYLEDSLVYYGEGDISHDMATREVFQKATQKNLFIVENVTGIDLWSFRDMDSLEYVYMADSVANIGTEVFKGCDSLNEVRLSENLQTIGEGAFMECVALRKITIPASVTEIGPYAFRESGLRKVELQEGLKKIGKWAFYQADLREVYLPDGVEWIDELAFGYCDTLLRVRIPESVIHISPSAFNGCGTTYQGAYYGSDACFLTIVGKPGSLAEVFALEQGYNFEAE